MLKYYFLFNCTFATIRCARLRDLEKAFEKKSLLKGYCQQKASKGNHQNDLCIIQKKRKGWRAEFKLRKKAIRAKNAAEIAGTPKNEHSAAKKLFALLQTIQNIHFV